MQRHASKKPLSRWVIVAVLVLAAALAAYPFAINWFAFYPDQQDLISGDQVPDGVEEVWIETEDDQKLQCYWLPKTSSSRIVLYFHGNAGNIGQRLSQLQKLAETGINVLGVGYRGYGRSTGRPTEQGIYADGRAALRYATERLGFDMHQVFLLGRSIGSTVALETARGRHLAGVILVTPLTTGKAMAQEHGFGPLAFFAGNKFNNLEKIGQLKAPLLIIHGTEDNVTPFYMGKRLFSMAPEPKQFVAIPGGGHNDIGWTGNGDSYWNAIADFLRSPISNPTPGKRLSNLSGKIPKGKRLLDEMHALVEDAAAGNHVRRITGHEQEPEFRLQ